MAHLFLGNLRLKTARRGESDVFCLPVIDRIEERENFTRLNKTLLFAFLAKLNKNSFH